MEWKTLMEPEAGSEKQKVSVTRSGFRIGATLIEQLDQAAKDSFVTVDLASRAGKAGLARIRFTNRDSAFSFPVTHAYKADGSLKSVTVNASQLGKLLSGNRVSGTLRLPATVEGGEMLITLREGEQAGDETVWEPVENLSAKMRVRVRITPDGIRMGRGIIRKLGKFAQLPFVRVEIKQIGEEVIRVRLILTSEDSTESFPLNRSGNGSGKNCPWDMIGMNSRALSKLIVGSKTLNFPAEVRGNEVTIVTAERPSKEARWKALDRDFGTERLSLVVTKNAVKIPKRVYTRIDGIERMNYALIAYRRLEDGLHEARVTFMKESEKGAVKLSWRGGAQEKATSLEIPSKALCALIAPGADHSRGERAWAEIDGDTLYLKQIPGEDRKKQRSSRR